MATNLEEWGGKSLVSGPLQKKTFLAASLIPEILIMTFFHLKLKTIFNDTFFLTPIVFFWGGAR